VKKFLGYDGECGEGSKGLPKREDDDELIGCATMLNSARASMQRALLTLADSVRRGERPKDPVCSLGFYMGKQVRCTLPEIALVCSHAACVFASAFL
jgi:hypothetical protein